MLKVAAGSLMAFVSSWLLASPVVAAQSAGPKTTPVVAADTADPAKLAEAHGIIAVMFPAKERQATLDKMMINLLKPMQAQLSMDRVTDPGLRELLNGVMSEMLERSRTISSNHFPCHPGGDGDGIHA